MSGPDHIRRRTLEELERELAEAREQQAATAQILAAISSSPTEAHHVFAQIAASAARLCDASNAGVLQIHGDHLRLVAHHGPIPADPIGQGRTPLTRGALTGRAVIERRTIQVADLQTETKEYPEGSEFARRLGYHTIVAVPLIRADEAIGAILIRRTEVRPFTDRQVDLLKTFADQAVIAIENTRLFEAEQASKRELQESLEYQTATSAVLNVISRSKSDVQPVFDAIVKSAAELFDPCAATITTREGSQIVWQASAARHNVDRLQQMARTAFPVPFDPERSPSARAMLERRIIEIPDVSALEGNAVSPAAKEFTRSLQATGVRSIAFVPLLHTDEGIGTIVLGHPEPGFRLSLKQRALVQTFADQAVIAIENTRLLNELRESLQQQTATADVLKVISRSAFNLQTVLAELIRSAVPLCEADFGHIRQRVGELYPVAASFGLTQEQHALFASSAGGTASVTRGSVPGRALIERRIVHFPDVLNDPEFTFHDLAKSVGFRAAVGVPLISNGQIVGVMTLNRATPGAFSEKQLALLETFADQAVIAIENTRLFEAEQASKRELQESLEYQTATSDVLGVIAASTTDIQPVLQTLVESACRLCAAYDGIILLREGDWLQVKAHHGPIPANVAKRKITRDWVNGRCVADCVQIHLQDVQAEVAEYPEGVALARRVGARTIVATPLMREGEAIGAMMIRRDEVRPFTDKQIALVKTFADQAVIAIENTRLFEEVQARTHELSETLEQQTATSEVLSVISKSPANLAPVFRAILEKAVRICEAEFGVLLGYENDTFEPTAWVGVPPDYEEFLQARGPFRPESGAPLDRLLKTKSLVLSADEIAENSPSPAAKYGGARSLLAVPMFKEDNLVGAIVIYRTEVRPFIKKHMELVSTFANQAVIAVENTKLFEELQARTSELANTVEDLEIASQHKNQFVANMSHELRTPLAAILGYAELMQEGFYGNQSQKSMDALTRIRSNGKHLLGLINTVLDIAKIESGQFTLNMSEYAIESVVETVRAATESLAQNKKLTLTTSVDKSLPVGLGDEQRLTQVLLNLVGNAIKFTDAGEVRIAAGARNGNFSVSVTDTGPGIPLDQQDRIFEQFHQVDSSNTKAKGGTGLGLAIAKQIVEMHGGRIWVESIVGKGSTFQMELPTRAEFHKRMS
jgi:signal transduction histidine kinase